jgi:hypothetical protein
MTFNVINKKEVKRLFDNSVGPYVKCRQFKDYCSDLDYDCSKDKQTLFYTDAGSSTLLNTTFKFANLENFEIDCVECYLYDYKLNTIIFNTFIFCQIFNEYSSRKLFDELNMFSNFSSSYIFLAVSIFSIGIQILLVEKGRNEF